MENQINDDATTHSWIFKAQFLHEQAVYRKDVNGRRITRDNRHTAP